jgi:hypothetical protein
MSPSSGIERVEVGMIVVAIIAGVIASIAIASLLEPHGTFELLCRVLSPFAKPYRPVSRRPRLAATDPVSSLQLRP